MEDALTRQVEGRRTKASLLSQLARCAPETKKAAAIGEALSSAGGIDDRSIAIQAIARFALELASDARDAVLREALDVLSKLDPRQVVDTAANVGWRLPVTVQAAWAKCASEAASSIMPGTLQSATAMARVVNIFPQAPRHFTATALRIVAGVTDDEVGHIYRDLIGRRSWRTVPAVWQAFWAYNRVSPLARAMILTSLIRRYPHFLSYLRSDARIVVTQVQDIERRLDLLANLARLSRGQRRIDLIEEATDLLRPLLMRQESGQFFLTSQYHPLRSLFETGSASNRNKIRQTVSDLAAKTNKERLLHYEILSISSAAKGRSGEARAQSTKAGGCDSNI